MLAACVGEGAARPGQARQPANPRARAACQGRRAGGPAASQWPASGQPCWIQWDPRSDHAASPRAVSIIHAPGWTTAGLWTRRPTRQGGSNRKGRFLAIISGFLILLLLLSSYFSFSQIQSGEKQDDQDCREICLSAVGGISAACRCATRIVRTKQADVFSNPRNSWRVALSVLNLERRLDFVPHADVEIMRAHRVESDRARSAALIDTAPQAKSQAVS